MFTDTPHLAPHEQLKSGRRKTEKKKYIILIVASAIVGFLLFQIASVASANSFRQRKDFKKETEMTAKNHTQELDKMQSELDAEKSKVAARESELKKSQSRVTVLESELVKVQSELARAQHAKEAAQQALHEKTDELEANAAQVASLQSSLDSTKIRAIASETLSTNTQHLRAKLLQEKTAGRRQDELASQIDVLVSQRDELVTHRDDLASQLEQVRSQLAIERENASSVQVALRQELKAMKEREEMNIKEVNKDNTISRAETNHTLVAPVLPSIHRGGPASSSPYSSPLRFLPFPGLHHQMAWQSRECKSLYLMVPKAGSISIREMISQRAPACRAMQPRALQEIRASELRASGDMAWTFVRDPLKRFISLYNYINPLGHWKKGSDLPTICSWGCETIWHGGEAGTTSRYPHKAPARDRMGFQREAHEEFRLFVLGLEQALRSQAHIGSLTLEDGDSPQIRCSNDYRLGSLINWHWLPQVWYMTDSENQLLPLRFAGKLESFPAEWSQVARRLNTHTAGRYPADAQLIHINEGSAPGRLDFQWECKPKGTFGAASEYCRPLMRRQDLDPSTVRAICRIYAVDYAVFNYTMPPECQDRQDPDVESVQWYPQSRVQCGRRPERPLTPVRLSQGVDAQLGPEEMRRLDSMQDRFKNFQNGS